AMAKLANWDTAISLFTDEYNVPLLPPALAAYMALAIELTTPVLLVLGLFTRAAALVLLCMTAVIEIFIYPQAWPTHIQWAAMLLVLLFRGAGAISLDNVLWRRFGWNRGSASLAAWRNRAAGISCNFAWKLESPGLVPGFFEQVAAHKSQLRFRSFVRFELELGQNQSKWYNMRQRRNGQVTEKTVKTQRALSRRFCVAPMMEWTDRHCRFFHRLLTRRTLIYTEMLTTGAVLHGDRVRLLGFDSFEHPVALQLGGSDPWALAQSARIAEDVGYDEINLNVGCPSDRVQEGRFGACLMAEPSLVGDCVVAMKSVVKVPVTVKCRIGIDDQNPDDALFAFTSAVKSAGIDALIVHARKAWLKRLSPRENREMPPLD